jgi:hypothetical protein
LKILETNCVRCHHDLVNDILGHGSTRSSTRDSTRGSAGSATTNCVHCHAAVGHGPQR